MTLGIKSAMYDLGVISDVNGFLISELGVDGCPIGSSSQGRVNNKSLSVGVSTDSSKSGLISNIINAISTQSSAFHRKILFYVY